APDPEPISEVLKIPPPPPGAAELSTIVSLVRLTGSASPALNQIAPPTSGDELCVIVTFVIEIVPVLNWNTAPPPPWLPTNEEFTAVNDPIWGTPATPLVAALLSSNSSPLSVSCSPAARMSSAPLESTVLPTKRLLVNEVAAVSTSSIAPPAEVELL